MDLQAPDGWDLSLEATADGNPVVIAELRLSPPAWFRLRVRGVEVAGEGADAVVRMSPYADLGVEVEARELLDADTVADALGDLRRSLRAGIRAAAANAPR